MSEATTGYQPELTGFRVVLHNFEGPFDLLVQLITEKKLDITEIALAAVTEDFIEYTRALGEMGDLEQTTKFLLVAATLLDIKAARLLPQQSREEESDLEFLANRDLLFARLIQYRAFQEVAETFREWQESALKAYPRTVGPDPEFLDRMAPLSIDESPQDFAELAAAVLREQPPEEVDTAHVHSVPVSVPQQSEIVLAYLQELGPTKWATFAYLTHACETSMEVIGRFLALLELYKAHLIDAEQPAALAELQVRWTGEAAHDVPLLHGESI